MAPRRGIQIGYPEAKAHAAIMAVVGWLLLTGFECYGSGDQSMFGLLNCSDFIHFHTLGDADTRAGGVWRER